MGKKKSSGYEDALQSIYDLVFTGKKKKPVKGKPTKYSGIDANKQMVNALAEIASKPANFASKTLIDTANLYGGIELVKLYASKSSPDDESGRYRIRAGDVGKWLQNPDKFVDSVYANVADSKKAARYLNIGRGMESALTFLWVKNLAKKNNLNIRMTDAWNTGMAAGDYVGVSARSEASNMMLRSAGMGYVRHSLGDVKLSQEIDDLLSTKRKVLKGPEGEQKLRDILLSSTNSQIRSNADGLAKEIYSSYQDKYGRFFNDNLDYTGGLTRLGFAQATQDYYLQKARCLDPKDPDFAKKRMGYLQVYGALDLINKVKGDGPTDFATLKDISSRIGGMQKKLSLIENSNDPIKQKYALELRRIFDKAVADQGSSNNKKRLTEMYRAIGQPYQYSPRFVRNTLLSSIDFEIKRTEMMLEMIGTSRGTSDPRYLTVSEDLKFWKMQKESAKSVPLPTWSVAINDLVGAYRSVDQYILKGGLASSVLDGTFFNTGDTFLNPGKLMSDHMKFNNGFKYGGGSLVIPREDIHPIIAEFSNLYYLTPQSVLKTFVFNGEGFSYLAFRNRLKLARKFSNPRFLNSAEGRALMKAGLGAFLDPIHGRLSAEKVALGFDSFIKVLDGNMDQIPPELRELIKSAKKLDIDYSKLAKFFNTPASLWRGVTSKIDKAVWEKFRIGVTDFLVKKLGIKIEKKVVEGFIARSIGFQQLLKAAVTAILESIGIAGGPLGTLLATILSWLVSDMLYKMSKPVLKVVNAMLWAFILGSIAIIGLLIVSIFGDQPTMAIYSPDDIVAGADENYLFDRSILDLADDGVYANAPEGNTCPVYQTPHCSQGNGADSSSYHQQYLAMDIGTRGSAAIWYAPADGIVTRAEDASYDCGSGLNRGGTVVYQDDAGTVYYIFHVAPLFEAGARVEQGQAVARAQLWHELGLAPNTGMACWTAPHFHLHTTSNGQKVDTIRWYKDVLNCPISGC